MEMEISAVRAFLGKTFRHMFPFFQKRAQSPAEKGPCLPFRPDAGRMGKPDATAEENPRGNTLCRMRRNKVIPACAPAAEMQVEGTTPAMEITPLFSSAGIIPAE